MDVCAAADVGGAGINGPAGLLESFRIRPAAGSAPFVPQRGVHVSNLLGTFSVDMVRPIWLLVPTTEGTQASIPSADNYECYKTRLSRGQSSAKGFHVEPQVARYWRQFLAGDGSSSN